MSNQQVFDTSFPNLAHHIKKSNIPPTAPNKSPPAEEDVNSSD